jgi:hypothetical protein
MVRRAEHYLGTYWSATEGRHVFYESRLELARLLFADFDRSVHRICAQPFLLTMRSTQRTGIGTSRTGRGGILGSWLR